MLFACTRSLFFATLTPQMRPGQRRKALSPANIHTRLIPFAMNFCRRGWINLGVIGLHNAEPIKNLGTVWRTLHLKAGFDHEVMLYFFRHTVARNFRVKGVPAREVAEQLGHRKAFQVTELYTSHSPDYVTNAIEAIDTFFAS